MGDLPIMPRSSGIRRTIQMQFGGLDRSAGAADGTLWDTKNLTTDELPLIATRGQRKKYPASGTKAMLALEEGLLLLRYNGIIYLGGNSIGWVSMQNVTTECRFIPFGRQVMLMPHKVLLHTEYGATLHFSTLEGLQSYYSSPQEGTAGLVGSLSGGSTEPCTVKVYVYTQGQWTDCGYFVETKEFFESGSVMFLDGTYQDAPAKGNTIIIDAQWSMMFPFQEGDTVTIAGASIEENNKTAIIRGVDGRWLTFYPETFKLPTYPAKAGPLPAYKTGTQTKIIYAAYFGTDIRSFELEEYLGDKDMLVQKSATNTVLEVYRNGVQISTVSTTAYTPGTSPQYDEFIRFEERLTLSRYNDSVTIRRGMPSIENCFADENRLWGTIGSKIYASKLGDPFNFDTFEGLSTDSYFLEVQTPGDFTAGCSAYGYPTFFKADYIYRIYGAKPDTYQLQELAANGVKPGCGKSIAMADNTLLYLSNVGVMAYSGGYPEKCDQALGSVVLSDAAAGSDGQKYFLCAKENGGVKALYVFDVWRGTWLREQEINLTTFTAAQSGLLALETQSGGTDTVWALAGDLLDRYSTTTQEGAIASAAEFGDITMQVMDRKSVHRVQMRLIVGAGATVTVAIRYDSAGDWITVKTIEAMTKQSVYLPVLPRRCDHFRLRITGSGEWKLCGLGLDLRQGSEQF